MSGQPIRALLDAVSGLVREQGFVVARALEQRSPIALGSTRKSSIGDLVTKVDLSVQEELTLGLGRLVPEASFLGEEGLNQVRDGLVWIIDPVDGTTNLVHGLPHVAISVGLYDSGSAALGVVHNPVTDTSYFAAAGYGSSERIGLDSSRERRLHVSDVATLDGALASFGLPYDRSLTEPIFRTLAAVFSRSQDLRRSGSAALDLAILARGNLDIHVEATVRPWDCAAGGLILEEAGGVVTDWNGDGIRWLDHIPGSSVLASNGYLHEELLAVVQSA
jgi:myo-inositol-1(or 4)-monophosphatase